MINFDKTFFQTNVIKSNNIASAQTNFSGSVAESLTAIGGAVSQNLTPAAAELVLAELSHVQAMINGYVVGGSTWLGKPGSY